MATQAIRYTITSAVLLLFIMVATPFAKAQCGCPSGGGDAPKATSGLGQAKPNAVDLASDPAWQVYEFERDGIRYLQIDDSANTTRAAIGQIDTTAWVLPIGRDADRVSIQAGAQPPTTGRIVYRDQKVEVVYYRQSNQDRWIVRPAASSR